MKVTLLLFAQMRIRANQSRVELDLPASATVAEAVEALCRQHPELRGQTSSCMTAVGIDYAPPDHVLREGDELSLIPPVQGGGPDLSSHEGSILRQLVQRPDST